MLVSRVSDRKNIGNIKKNIFTKNVRKSKHLFRKIPGWAIDTQIIETLKLEGVTLIRIIEKEEKKIYTATIENFEKHSLPIHFGNNGEQLLLGLEYWTIEE